MDTKICKKCGIEKPISEFHNQKSMKDGKRTRCKSCERIYQREYNKKIHEMRERADMLVAFRLLKRDIKKLAKKEVEEY